MQDSEPGENINSQLPPQTAEEDEKPSLLVVKIINSLRLMGNKSLDMRNIPGEMGEVTEALRWLEKRKFIEVTRGTMISKGKDFAQWSY